MIRDVKGLLWKLLLTVFLMLAIIPALGKYHGADNQAFTVANAETNELCWSQLEHFTNKHNYDNDGIVTLSDSQPACLPISYQDKLHTFEENLSLHKVRIHHCKQIVMHDGLENNDGECYLHVVLQLQHAPPMHVCCVFELASQHDELCEHQEMAMQEASPSSGTKPSATEPMTGDTFVNLRLHDRRQPQDYRQTT